MAKWKKVVAVILDSNNKHNRMCNTCRYNSTRLEYLQKNRIRIHKSDRWDKHNCPACLKLDMDSDGNISAENVWRELLKVVAISRKKVGSNSNELLILNDSLREFVFEVKELMLLIEKVSFDYNKKTLEEYLSKIIGDIFWEINRWWYENIAPLQNVKTFGDLLKPENQNLPLRTGGEGAVFFGRKIYALGYENPIDEGLCTEKTFLFLKEISEYPLEYTYTDKLSLRESIISIKESVMILPDFLWMFKIKNWEHDMSLEKKSKLINNVLAKKGGML